jgi:hypothetical protein
VGKKGRRGERERERERGKRGDGERGRRGDEGTMRNETGPLCDNLTSEKHFAFLMK